MPTQVRVKITEEYIYTLNTEDTELAKETVKSPKSDVDHHLVEDVEHISRNRDIIEATKVSEEDLIEEDAGDDEGS